MPAKEKGAENVSAGCIFCRIAAGEMPGARVYEDEHVVAFLDIAPLDKGHTLVVPRAHHADIAATPEALLGRLIAAVAKVARAQIRALNARGVNVTQANGTAAGQVVPHIHFHVIPRPTPADKPDRWQPGTYAGPEEMAAYAERIRAAVGS